MKEDIDLELMNLIRLTENAIKRAKQKDGIVYTGHGRIIAAIYRNSGITQSQLADILEIRPQSLTRALTQLEEQGLIYRQRSKDDRRNVSVYISQKGLEHHEQIADSRRSRAQLIFNCLDDAQKKELRDLLSAVIDAYNRTETEKQ